jgi:hypothetical protein
LHEGAPNKGKSHATLIDFNPNLHCVPGFHHFLTLHEAPIKSHRQVSNEEPLINYNKNIIMTNEL